MVRPVPTLTSTGWLTDIAKRADALMSYYLTSEYSQTSIYKGKVTSLTYHVQQHNSNPEKLQSTVESDLRVYFERYFDSVDLTVTTNLPNPDDPNRVNLQIDVVVYEGEYRYSLGQEIRSANGKVIEIIKLMHG